MLLREREKREEVKDKRGEEDMSVCVTVCASERDNGMQDT
jgi:hypothetical protein|tara:strand:+ start:800 stop:919 length:120 start_codon:yes stop_codon:yes gene_type:complete